MIPPLLLGSGLLFWGYQTGLWIPALLLAFLAEASRIVPWRIELSRQGFHRISDLSTLLFTAAAIYFYFAEAAIDTITLLLQWLPVVLSPVLLAQKYSAQGKVDASTFFWSWRARQKAAGPREGLDMSFPYLALCVFSASAANQRTPVFFFGAAGLGAWALWRARPARGSRIGWALMLSAAVVLGWTGQDRLHRTQRYLERTAARIIFSTVRVGKDPLRTYTAIGTLERLKDSGAILLRVRSGSGRPPELLRNASYDLFKGRDWFATERGFTDVAAGPKEGEWDFLGSGTASRAGAPRRLTVSTRLPEGRGLLTLPDGVRSIRGLPAAAVKRNRLGSVQTEYAPPLAVYTVEYGSSAGRDGPPENTDLKLAEGSREEVEKIARSLGLRRMRPGAAVAAVARFLREGFSYSVYRRTRRGGTDAIADFLTRTKAGHCEYFATAAVLLLRAGEVPARYATGYYVGEYSSLEDAWLLRQRHAHAWARAYAGGRWVDVDTTPPSWFEVEERRAPFWQPAGDLFSWARNAFLEWRERDGSGGSSRFIWVLLPLIVFMGWRIYLAVRGSRSGRPRAGGAAASLPGMDSELFEIERILNARGFSRRPHETFRTWIRRLRGLPEPPEGAGELEPLAALHSRYRFDPEGLEPRERDQLRRGVRAWVERSRADDPARASR